jgi:hypothetical protein
VVVGLVIVMGMRDVVRFPYSLRPVCVIVWIRTSFLGLNPLDRQTGTRASEVAGAGSERGIGLCGI